MTDCQPLTSELIAALTWALEQIEDSLDLDHAEALAAARALVQQASRD